MSGLFVGAFLSHFLGFIGPFAFVGNKPIFNYCVLIGIVSFLLALFLSKMITFVKPAPKNEKDAQLSLLNNKVEEEEDYIKAKNILYGSHASN